MKSSGVVPQAFSHNQDPQQKSRLTKFMTRCTDDFSHFTTSMTAPVAFGWSDRRVRLAPT